MSQHWNNRVVAITGGSRGLGLALARCFAVRGCRLALIARDQDRLSEAVSLLQSEHPVEAAAFTCDLTDPVAVQNVVSGVGNRWGQIDVWVNCAGRSTRCRFSETTVADYRDLMELNFFAAVQATMAALSWLQRTDGALVNIGSLASRTAWPWVGPYVASKHALAGFTEQVRLEGPANVRVVHVCPGPIARPEDNRYAQESEGLGDQAQKPGAGAPVRRIDPEWLAERIIRAIERREPEVVIPWKARLLFALRDVAPRWQRSLLKRLAATKRNETDEK